MEVKYLVIVVGVAAALLSFVESVQANHFLTCSPGCNTTTVWWNDSVSVNGTGAVATAVAARVNGITACTTTSSSTGFWNCTFSAPTGVGNYNLSVAVGSAADDITLKVRPSYGEKPTGTAQRFVIEIPSVIQEPSGVLKMLVSRLTVSHGPPA